MIGKITGILSNKEDDHILIDVQGVGYEVFLSDSNLAKISLIGEKVSIYTELIVREDLLQLVGFTTRQERKWYRLLTGVQGVGSKAALKILGTLQMNVLSRSILTGDAVAIKATPGIGPKIAQRIVTELKDKAPSLMSLTSDSDVFEETLKTIKSPEMQPHAKKVDFSQSNTFQSDHPLNTSSSNVQSEALSALTNLGYTSYDAALAISNVSIDQNKFLEVQELIKLALQNLSSKA